MSRIIKETTVYGGPRTSGYATMATLHQNQSVTAIFKELDFLFVEYDGVNRTKRRGYVLARDVQLQESVRTYTALATNKAIRVVVTSAAVFEGPAFSGYMKLGSFSENAFISFLGIKENDFALVEMKNHAGVVRGYFYANYLRTFSNRVGSIISDTNSTGYLSPLNKFTAGQCTWYCWGRAYEKCGANITFSGGQNGNQWYANVSGGYKAKYPASHTPVANSVCSCNTSSVYGHVLFIEAVEDGYVYFTEDNWAADDPALRRMTVSEFTSNRQVIGYIAV